jgi:ABC-type xylose transport system permease subunit
MPATVPPLVVLGPTAVVLVALFLVLWRERTSTRDARIAIVSGAVLSLWAVVATVLAYRGVFQPKDAESVPPVGINLVVVLSVLFVSLATSTSFCSWQKNRDICHSLPSRSRIR